MINILKLKQKFTMIEHMQISSTKKYNIIKDNEYCKQNIARVFL